jgi:hypothetical protein
MQLCRLGRPFQDERFGPRIFVAEEVVRLGPEVILYSLCSRDCVVDGVPG